MIQDKEQDFKQRLLKEMYRYLTYTAFFTLFFWAFLGYRRLILGEYAISYVHYGYCVFEAMVLSKIIILGQMLGLGTRYDDRSLAIPTAYKTIVFMIFVLILSVFEAFFMGYLHGKNASAVFQRLLSHGLDEILARLLVMSFLFVLFFAFLETSRVLGGNRLFEMFFRRTPNMRL